MINPRKEETVHERNSLAKDAEMHTKSIAEAFKVSNDAKGYLSLAGGLLLLLINYVYPNLLTWVLTLASVGLVLYGAKLIHLWDKAKTFFNFLKARFGRLTKK